MGLDIYIYLKCDKCGNEQTANVYEKEGKEFNPSNEEHWELAQKLMPKEISKVKGVASRNFLAEEIGLMDCATVVSCEKCKHALLLYDYSY